MTIYLKQAKNEVGWTYDFSENKLESYFNKNSYYIKDILKKYNYKFHKDLGLTFWSKKYVTYNSFYIEFLQIAKEVAEVGFYLDTEISKEAILSRATNLFLINERKQNADTI